MERREEWREQLYDPDALSSVPVVTGVVDPTPSVKERPREGAAGVDAEAEAHRGASGAGDRKRIAGGAGLAEMHAARAGWGDAVPGGRWRHTARVTTDAVGGWRGPLVPAAVSADSERRGRAVPVPRDDVAKSRGHAGHGLVGDAGRESGRAAPFLGRRAQAERMLCACGGSCGARGGGVVRGVADGGAVGVGVRGGDLVLPSPIVAVRGEGLVTPPRHQYGHRLRVLRLQHYSVSVNMFGPLLQLPGPFSASFQCYSLTSWGEG